jgi:hypothetical protein
VLLEPLLDGGTAGGLEGSLPGEGVRGSDIVGIALTPDAEGNWFAGANGLTYPFGDATNLILSSSIGSNLPVVAIGST